MNSQCWNPRVVRTENGPIVVRCQHCLPCLKHRQSEWITRFREENKSSTSVYFVTLTYEEEKRPKKFMEETGRLEPAVVKEHVIKLHKDMRKRFQQGFFYDSTFKDLGLQSKKDKIELPDCNFRFYVTSEYGSRGINPHYHGIYWNLPDDIDLVLCLFKSLWPFGFVTVYPGTDEATAAYTAKYLVNDSLVKSYGPRPFALMSKGLGRSYLENDTMLDWHRSSPVQRCYVPIDGHKSIMPRYFRDRIFDDDMKAAIAIDSERRNRPRGNFNINQFLQERKVDLAFQKEAFRQALWNFQKKNKIK